MSEFPIHLDSTGVVRSLSLQPSPPAFGVGLPRGDILALSDIREFSTHPQEIEIKDQGQIGACTYHGLATTGEGTRAAAGMTYVPLSPWYGYSQVARGRNVGTSISESLEVIKQVGLAPESMVPWGTIDPRYLSAESHAAAKRFRCEIGANLTTWQEILSAVALGRYVTLSVVVGNGFDSLDSDGVPPAYRGAANHAICVGGGLKFSAKKGPLLDAQNSWGERWGMGGRFRISQAHIDNAQWFEAITLVAVYDDPQDVTNPPMVA